MKLPFSSLFAIAAIVACSIPGMAQQDGFTCGANEFERMGDLVVGHPERLQEIAHARQELEQFTANWQGNAVRGGENYVIPVVFHIIHNNGPENISDEQVEDAIRILNEDYNKLNPDWSDVRPEFLDIVADVGFTFALAKLDPDGNCTNGITRTVSSLTYVGDQEMKYLIDWPRDRYLNIWVAASAQGAAGYSYYPSSVDSEWGEGADGIVVLHDYVGSIGTSDPSHSRVLSHEAGHWINLAHCWGSTNDPGLPENCFDDDGVDDTPNTIGWTSCNLNGASCGSDLDNVENYMEYSYCDKMFTNGQKDRMVAAINSTISQRNNLWSASNMALTGVLLDPEICFVDLMSNKQLICAGESINFSDLSFNGVEDRTWEFQGGSPAVSNAQAPSVTYAVAGTYDVTLEVENENGSGTITKSQYITVLPTSGFPLPYTEGFEAIDAIPAANWTVNDIDGDGSFELSTSTGSTGTHSVRLHNTASKAGNKDDLISNTIDISTEQSVVIDFRYAFARRYNGNNDRLRVYVSRDCGVTWSLRKAMDGDDLSTAPNTNAAFIPTSGQWGSAQTLSITGPYLVSDLRVKFQFQSDGGNDLWLDDINIASGWSGVEEASGSGGLSMYLLPMEDGENGFLRATLPLSGPVKVEVLDVLGRTVRAIANETKPAGAAEWTLPLQDLRQGVYLIRLQQGDLQGVVRFVKN